MIRSEKDLEIAQSNIRKIEQALLIARRTYPPTEYQRMSEPFLLELQERHAEVIAYLSHAEEQELAA